MDPSYDCGCLLLLRFVFESRQGGNWKVGERLMRV
jgi:hypothetical protein